MDDMTSPNAADSPRPRRAIKCRTAQSGMSYKFQRLRERIRSAVASGELNGKLPGERQLARRFHVNAKTLSKALTDLAAEGILDRSIGRGTYVKGAAPAAPTAGRWLVLAEPGAVGSPLVEALRAANPELQVAVSLVEMRPSFLNQFSAVVDIAPDTPDTFLRDLVVRNMPLVVINREPRNFSTHSVVADSVLGASRLGRDFLLGGHRRIAAVESHGSTVLSAAVRSAIARFGSEATVESFTPDDLQPMLDAGVTGIICDSCRTAEELKKALATSGIQVPRQVSLGAASWTGGSPPCSGYYCTVQQLTEAAIGLLRNPNAIRPATIWLAGSWHDIGTTSQTHDCTSEETNCMHIRGMVV